MAQEYDKEFYIIENLQITTLSEDDKLLLDTNLEKYHQTDIDTTKLDILNVIVEECWNDEVWPKYNELVLDKSQQLLEANKGNEKLAKRLTAIVAGALNNEGYYYKDLGDIPLALDYYEQSLKMDESIGNKEGVALSYNNLGTIYLEQDMQDEALDYFQKSLAIQEEVGNKYGISLALNNIASIYFHENKVSEAKDYFIRSYAIDLETNNYKGAGNSLNNLGYIYKNTNEPDSALMMFKDALFYFRKADRVSGVSLVQCNIGGLYFQNGDLRLARAYTDSALVIGREIGYPFSIKNASELLYRINYKEKKWEAALEMHELYVTMKDSLKNIETERKSERQQLQYQFDKQHALAEAEHEKELLIAEESQRRHQLINYFTFGGLILVIGFAYFVYTRLKLTRKQKQLIEEKNDELEIQKNIVEEKNTEILDSIHYAQRIQHALLKSEEHVTKSLPEHFVLFRPKDIISGDFYWSLEKDGYWYVTVADCTGHGVPGAMLTMLGNSFLNEITQVKDILSPATILDKLRDKVTHELSQTGEDGGSKDGMDISLVRMNLSSLEVEWAGANNPLWLLRKNSEEIEEIRGDRQPIGFYLEMQPFTNHKIKLEKGDCFYLFSDGFADQFGGDRGKKLKYKPFKEKLVGLRENAMSKQKVDLEKHFVNWMGDYQQIDDVCVIGVRL